MADSGMESKRRVADPHRVAIAERGLRDARAADEGAVLTPEIAQLETSVDRLDRRVMSRDRRVRHYDVIVERATDARRRARPQRKSIAIVSRQVRWSVRRRLGR